MCEDALYPNTFVGTSGPERGLGTCHRDSGSVSPPVPRQSLAPDSGLMDLVMGRSSRLASMSKPAFERMARSDMQGAD